MPYTRQNRDVIHALIESQGESLRNTSHTVLSGCDVTVNTGDLGSGNNALSVASGEVLLGGPTPVSIASQSVSLPAANSSYPRWDLVVVDESTQAVEVRSGQPMKPNRGGDRLRARNVLPPDLAAQDATPLALVWIPAGANSIDSTAPSEDIFDVRPMQTVPRQDADATHAAQFYHTHQRPQVPNSETAYYHAGGYDLTDAGGRTNGAVHLRFDDAQPEDYTDVFPELRDRRLTGGFALIPDRVRDGNAASLAQYHEMQARGMHFMAHNYERGYNNIRDIPLTEWYEMVIGSDGLDWFLSNGIVPQGWVKPGPLSFTGSPYDLLDSVHGQLLRQVHDLIQLGSHNQPGDEHDRPPVGEGVMPHHGQPSSLTEAQTMLDLAQAEGTVVTFVFHSNSLVAGNDWLTWTDFQTLLDDIQTRRDNGNLDCVSWGHLAYTHANQQATSLLPNGGFETGAIGDRNNWSVGSGTPSFTTMAARSGAQSLDCPADTATNQYATINVDLRGVDGLLIEAWFRSQTTANAAARLRARTTDASGTFRNPTVGGPVADTWDRLSLLMGTGPENRHVSIDVGHFGDSEGLYVDDVAVYPM